MNRDHLYIFSCLYRRLKEKKVRYMERIRRRDVYLVLAVILVVMGVHSWIH